MKLLPIFLLFSFYSSAQNEVKIDSDSLPLNVRTTLIQKYGKCSVNAITKNIDTSGVITYKIELQKKNKVIELTYSNDGRLLHKEKSKSYTFDGKEKRKPKQEIHNDGHNHQH